MTVPNGITRKPFPVVAIPQKELIGKHFTIINTIRKEDQFNDDRVYYLTYIISHVNGKLYKCFFKGVAISDFLERVISGEIYLPCYAELEETRSEGGRDYLSFKTFFNKQPGALDAEEEATF